MNEYGICGAERKTRTGTWVCLMPPHRSNAKSGPATDRLRRKQFGKPVHSDRHVFVKRGNGPGQTGTFLRNLRRTNKETGSNE